MSGKDLGITVKKDQDLSEWYTQVVTKAQLADYSSAKGFMVLMPYGYSIWEKIKEDFDKKIKAIGHKNAYFPLLIPERLLKTETEHFAGFTPEVFWVTHSGDSELAEKLAVRPTSETIIYESYSKWVKSWRDLPILINVWNSVVRAEITSTRPFLRTTEFLWQEGHTVHETEKEAEEEVMTILEIYTKLVEDKLAIPILVGKKTEREKFKGAVYTTTMEAMMPDGKALQMGTSHHLGQKCSIHFEIKYMGKDEKDQKDIAEQVKHLSTQLEQIGIRTLIDDRAQYTPGWKYHEWEMKGVPLRVEIGPRDLQAKQVTLVRRDTREKIAVNRSEAKNSINSILDEIQNHLYERAKHSLDGLTTTVSNMQSFKKVVEGKGGFIKTFLSDDSCEVKIKIETGATVRVVPMKATKKGNCVYCGADGSNEVYFARSY